MAARITDIFPFLLITLLCVVFVEGGYQALEYFGLRTPVEKVTMSETVSVKAGQAEKIPANKKQDYQIILQRNLFGPAPGKTEPAATESDDHTEDLQTTSLDIVLMGTINGGDETDRAIILDKSKNKQELYEVGDAIQGAFIKEILRGKVILAYNGKDEMLDMSEASKVRSAYAVPRAAVGSGTAPLYRPQVSPGETPRRVINRPRAIRPSRLIRNN